MLPGIGGLLARNLLAYVGSAEGIFKASLVSLKKIPGIGDTIARRIKNTDVLVRAERELEFISKHHIRVLFFTDDSYPRRLKSCVDSPILLYVKGDVILDEERVVSIVGTRNATDYGKALVDDLVEALAERSYRVLVVSGLAYGIDVQAHRAALRWKVPTVGVLAHGLDMLYPAMHREVARQMIDRGGLVTDFPSTTRIDPANFLKRNRIVAGLADATIVVESAEKGGALVTADIASSYNRDVFAFPGRVNDPFSKGCNFLIRTNAASLIQGIEDLEYFMGWEAKESNKTVQPDLFIELTENEQKILSVLRTDSELFIDQIAYQLQLPVSKVSPLLIQLEFKNLISALPGQRYRLR